MKMNDYYRNKRILVTGGMGFLGQHVVDSLSEYDCNIVIPAAIDLSDPNQCAKIFLSEGPFDIVFHLAAKCRGIKDNVTNGLSYYTTNCLIDLHTIDNCHKFRAGKVVATGSVCMYPDSPDVPINESLILDGTPSPENYYYGMAKRALLLLCKGYHEQYGMKIAFPVLSNLYGPGDHFFDENAHVIPSIITKFYQNDPVLWGDGTPTRDFLYVKDAAEIMVRAAARIDDPEPFNVSPSSPLPVSALVDKIARRMGVNSYEWDTSMPNGTMHRHYSNQKMLRAVTNFEFTSLDNGLDETIRDFRKEVKSRGLPVFNAS